MSPVRTLDAQNRTLDAQNRTLDAQNESKRVSPHRLWILRALIVVGVVAPLVGIFVAPTKQLVGLFAIVLMFVLLVLRIPVMFALAVPGVIGIYSLTGTAAASNVLISTPLTTMSSWSLSVLPMFVLMGLLLWQSGLTTRMYEGARNWLGWLPGGLGVGTNAAGAGLAAVSGSTLATTYALARIGIPEMLRAGYGKQMTLGSVIVAGLPGQLIPPSVFLVIVAGLLENPVGPQLMAGVVPGLTVAALFAVMIVGFSILFPAWVGGRKRIGASWRARWVSLANIWPLVAIMLLVLGGMFTGIFTATEAGAAGVLGSLIACIWFQRKNKPLAMVGTAIVDTISSVGAIFFVLVGAHILAALISVTGLGQVLANFAIDAELDRIQFLILIMVLYILLGTFMDPLAILLTTIPILLPVLHALDIDLLWFGVFGVFMVELAILTPPVGMLSFVIHKIVQDPKVNLGVKFTLNDVFKAVWLFMPMAVIVTLLWIFFPDLVTWLPSLMAR
ncbi:TRAP transporter large permease [Microbacterium sp. A93]|uniref:TRAP transporter large permease n=1 Tax=Microbacterium sp. A93 TaxID=3450716 RepID=UPI003F43499F